MTLRTTHFRSRRALAVALVLMSATTLRGEWVIVQPPVTGQRDCQLVYDKSAPISEWRFAWKPSFRTLDECEAMLAEIVRRSTSPGRREREVAYAKQREEEVLATEREMRHEARTNPELKRLLRALPKPRRGSSRICDVSVESWTDARCIERVE
jgi:hypothetical protein